MIQALNSSVSGIRQGFQMLDKAARNIAHAAVEDGPAREAAPSSGSGSPLAPGGGGLVDDLVSMVIAKHTVGVNAAAFKRTDATVGSLLDMLT